jgi:hypothetical protein
MHRSVRAEHASDDSTGYRAGQRCEALPDHLQGAIVPASVRRRRFDQERRGARELAAGREPLQQAGEHDEQRRTDADRCVWWSKAIVAIDSVINPMMSCNAALRPRRSA